MGGIVGIRACPPKSGGLLCYMADQDLQLENGNYTRVVNRVLEELSKAPLLGAELAVCIFVIRKTYGFNKKEDEISLTQFEQGLGRSRPTIVKALKKLQLVNILKLVKKGSSKKQSNLWVFNKYYDTWKLVKGTQLVKKKHATNKEIRKKLVKGPLHTKDNNKRQTKDIVASKDAPMIVALIDSFEEVNPAYKKWYARPPQREAARRLIETHGLERLQWVIKMLPNSNQRPYFPTITTPLQLEDRWAQLEAAWGKEKNKGLSSKNGLA